jgi:hypothetical protein
MAAVEARAVASRNERFEVSTEPEALFVLELIE